MERPLILIIDDLYGRTGTTTKNIDREDYCLRLGINDITGDELQFGKAQDIPDPSADVIFCSGQRQIGSKMENDIDRVMEVAQSHWGANATRRWALILVDLHFKTGSIKKDGRVAGREKDREIDNYFGLQICKRLLKLDPDFPIVILSGMDRDEVEPIFSEQKVQDFVKKDTLKRPGLSQLLWNYGLISDHRKKNRITGTSIPLLKCLRLARQRARSGNGNILILGETGTGKESLAQYIHDVSPRKSGSFVSEFLKGKPENLVDDAIFGHVKGAFSGADRDKPGAAERANGGSLYLDEFGEITMETQSKLLRLLDVETRESHRIGSHTAPKKLDLQVILATNRLDLLDYENVSDFREDLLFRIGISHPIILPTLSERIEDIPDLVNRFITEAVQKSGAKKRSVAPDALAVLKNHNWRGNIRDLKLTITNAVTQYPGIGILTRAHLPSEVVSQDEELDFTEHRIADHDQLDNLVRQIESFRFNGMDYAQLSGRLNQLLAACARLLARYIAAAADLDANKKLTPDKPQGEVQYHPTYKCISGDQSIKADPSKKHLKRILSIDIDAIKPLVANSILKDLCDRIRLKIK